MESHCRRKLALGSVGVLLAMGLFCVQAGAAYRYHLNPDVKDATPALKEAAQIGTVVFSNPAMDKEPNKDAFLVMSFGTTFKETREKTILAVVKRIQEAFPKIPVKVAFTSHIIIDRIQEKEGVKFDTPEEAFERLQKDGFTRVAVVTLDIVPGFEYSYDKAVTRLAQGMFKKMAIDTPLMYYMGQEEGKAPDQVIEFLQAVSHQMPKMGKDDAVLLMAHGTPHPANAYYDVIQNRIDRLGWKNVWVYTVEGEPRLDQVMPQLKARGIKHVTLMPIMMVAGDHANNDMAGPEPESHKSQLEAAGFKVDCYLHGLGENPQIQNIYVERATSAIKAMDDEKSLLPFEQHPTMMR